jgi:hypothetical protein
MKFSALKKMIDSLHAAYYLNVMFLFDSVVFSSTRAEAYDHFYFIADFARVRWMGHLLIQRSMSWTSAQRGTPATFLSTWICLLLKFCLADAGLARWWT